MNYQTAVYFHRMNYQTSLKLYSITSHKLNRSFKYFCRMLTKICPVNHISLALSSFLLSGYCKIDFCTLKQQLNSYRH